MTLRSVHINVTNRCNLKCKYCYFFDDDINVSNREPSLTDIQRWINEAEDLDAQLLVISGGEPTLRKDLATILSHGAIPKLLLTNAMTLDENAIRMLNDIETLKEIKISLDGFLGHDAHRGHATHLKVVEAIERIDKLGRFPYSIDTVITEANYRELDALYTLVASSLCYRWEIDFPLIRGRMTSDALRVKNIDELYQFHVITLINRYFADGCPFKMNVLGALRWEALFAPRDFQTFDRSSHPCQYAMDSLTIQTSGEVSFCPSLRMVFGNAHQSTLADILAGQQYRDFAALSVGDLDDCCNCTALPVCGGGCRADAMHLTGDIRARDSYSCGRIKALYDHVLPALDGESGTAIRQHLARSQVVL